MATVALGDNPNRENVGKTIGDAVTITSGFTNGTVIYQIRRRDQSEPTFSYTTDLETAEAGPEDEPQIVSVYNTTLKIILPFRTNFQVRCSNDGGSSWQSWTSFKTRDKRYQSPDAITQLTDTSWQHGATKTSHTITVTNAAKASVAYTDDGATVTNSDTFYVGTTSIEYTDAGATITNSD